MDAIFFRALAQEVREQVFGLRLGKVFAPALGLWTFDLGRPGFLVLCTIKSDPFVFLTRHKPANPSNPAGPAMWLRKRIRERRITDVRMDWPRRRMAFALSSPGEGHWLVLDLQCPPALVEELPREFDAEVCWPELESIVADTELWRRYPQVTPPLRRVLRHLPLETARELLRRIVKGEGGAYAVRDHQGHAHARAWPEGDTPRRCATALEAAQLVYEPRASALVVRRDGIEAGGLARRRKAERVLSRLEEDRQRLEGMRARGREAGWLRANLHLVEKGARLAHVEVYDEEGRKRSLALRPELTVLENMEYLFARAAKARRGLPVVAARMESMRRALTGGNAPPDCEDKAAGREPVGMEPLRLPSRYRGIKVGVFVSSDGFVMLRGRSAQANHQLLTRAASPFDYWLHAQDGPGAHVIIRRDSPRREVPERTIEEGACLAALSSHLRLSDRGDVLLCLVRDVRAIKGAALGMVMVDKVFRMIRPMIDPALERKLRRE